MIDSSGSGLPDATMERNLEIPTGVRIEESWMNLLLVSDLQDAALLE